MRVTKADFDPKGVVELTSTAAREAIEQQEKFIVKGSEEMRRDVDELRLHIRPLWGPALRSSPHKTNECLASVHRVQLLTRRRRTRCQVECFFVVKKDASLRLLADARLFDEMCR